MPSKDLYIVICIFMVFFFLGIILGVKYLYFCVLCNKAKSYGFGTTLSKVNYKYLGELSLNNNKKWSLRVFHTI